MFAHKSLLVTVIPVPDIFSDIKVVAVYGTIAKFKQRLICLYRPPRYDLDYIIKMYDCIDFCVRKIFLQFSMAILIFIL